MSKESDFFTFKSNQLTEEANITAAMEDYLEMISRIIKTTEYVRIHFLAEKLNVKPSSASKMVNNLKEHGLVTFEKYGYIKLTEKGNSIGEYLLLRHKIINEFLCFINGTTSELEQVEKIEHFLDRKTVFNIQRVTEIIKDKK